MRDFLLNGVYREDMENIYVRREKWSEFENSSVYISGAAGMIASYVSMFLIYLNEMKNMHIQIFIGVRNREKAIKRFGRYLEKDYLHIISQDVIRPLDWSVKYDYIIHAASLASPQYYGSIPVEIILPNVVGTYELLEYAKKQEVKSLLFFSSGSVYGSVSDCKFITEDMTGDLEYLKIGNYYGESKRCGEMLCKAYATEYGVPAKSIRIHHSYGPTLNAQGDTRVFSEFVNNILNNENIVVKGNGRAKRAFCYMTDAVAGVFKVLLDGKNGESYNLANNVEYVSISELAERLVSLFPEKNLKVEYGERNLCSSYAPNTSIKNATVSIEKLKSLGWNPYVTIEAGFYRTIKALMLEENYDNSG